MQTLTESQKEVYDYILRHHRNWQTLPTISEIQRGLYKRHYGAPKNIITVLMRKGYLEPSFTSCGYMVTALKNNEAQDTSGEGAGT